jgi:arylsulfatase A-like enzyme
MTGLSPWEHGALYGERATLRPELQTLAEALRERGYATTAYRSNYWTRRELGYAQGFDVFVPLRRAYRAQRELAGLRGGRTFVWIDLPAPSAPYVRDEEDERRVREALGAGHLPATLPRRLTPADLAMHFDPASGLTEERRRELWALYLMSVSSADRLLGVFFEALRQSGQWDDTLLVVTSTHGTVFGEYGRVGAGGSLGRRLIEVPLVLKLPLRSPQSLRTIPSERPALHRVFSTLVEAAGGKPVPAALPSLWREAAPGVLSELYRDNGRNHFSWLRGRRQLLWSVRFAPDEPEFLAAGMVLQGLRPSESLDDPVDEILARLDAALERRHPLYGSGEGPVLQLVEWTTEGTERSAGGDASEELQELAAELESSWCSRATGDLSLPATPCPVRDASRR